MKYSLFYAGYNKEKNIEQVGLLQSDNLSDWEYVTKTPLISIDTVHTYTKGQTSNPCVVCVGGVYKMWYQAKSTEGIFYILYAESQDLKNWKFNQEPVLTLGKGLGFRYGIQHPHVIYDGQRYTMWCTLTRNGGSVVACYQSIDGLLWEVVNTEVIRPEYTWEGNFIMYPVVIKDEKLYKMWYTGKSHASRSSIGYAESEDGVHWKKNNKPVISFFSVPKVLSKLIEVACSVFGFDIRIPLYGLASPFVWKENDYFMLTHEIGTHGKLYIALYKSADGKKWKKIKNNILEKVTLESWNTFFQGDPYVYVK